MLFAYPKLTAAFIVAVVSILSIIFFDYLTKKKGDSKDGSSNRGSIESDDES